MTIKNLGSKEMTTKKPSTKKTTANLRPVIVTTAHRGVFFGFATTTDGDTIKLTDARNCIYWTRECGGFMGLASGGPVGECRIGPKATIELRNITSVMEVTPEAAKRWQEFAVWR